MSNLGRVVRWGRLRIVGRGNNLIASLNVDDAARAALLCGTHPAADRRVYDVASDEPVTQREFINAVADALGQPPLVRRVPYRLAFLVAGVAECLEKTLGRPARVTRAMVTLMAVDQLVDTGAIRLELCWRPQTCFADGMKQMKQWYLQQQVVGSKPEPCPVGCSRE